MRKIRLEVDALRVESFVPAEAPEARGTVKGMASLYWEDCSPSETCDGGWPCGPSEQSCGGTCYEYSCAPGCTGTGGGGGGSHPGLGVPCSATCHDEDPTRGGGDC